MKTFIVCIKGIQGSGKTYVCKKLKNIPCIDTDDVLKNTFKNLLKTNKDFQKSLPTPSKNFHGIVSNKTLDILYKQAIKDLKKLIKDLNVPIIVVVGITLYVENDLTFFIKMNNKQLEQSYRRVMLREINKIKNNYNNIKKIINGDVNIIPQKMLFECEIGAINQLTTFAYYKRMYKLDKEYHEKEKSIIKTQDEIIKQIKTINKKLNV